jgi:hypothetical protein
VRLGSSCGGGGGGAEAAETADAAEIAETADADAETAEAAAASLSSSLSCRLRWALSGGDDMCTFCWHHHLRRSTFASGDSGRGSFGSGMG